VPGALACGFVFEIGGKKVYFAGDTALTKDMELLSEEDIDAALLPIGDVYTMGPEDAAKAAWMIRPKLVIPMHYGTFPIIEQTADSFCMFMQQRAAGIPVRVLSPGESLELS
jgi:L-ascorbate metabolism protein UlaG (beta-lactamase superfamily)